MIGAITLAAIFAALITGFTAKPIYRASVTVTAASPSDSANGGGLTALASRFGGVADLAGLSSLNASLQESLAVLQSRELTVSFVKKNNLLPELFHENWNEAEGRWKRPSLLARFKRFLSGSKAPANNAPPDWEIYRKFDKIRRIRIDKVAGVTVVSIEWRDPYIAAEWANKLVAYADEAIRANALAESQRSMEFLQNQNAQATNADVRQAIYQLTAQELKKSMFANVRSDFALKILDKAAPDLQRVWPRRSMLVILGLIGGLFFGSVAAVMRSYIVELRKFSLAHPDEAADEQSTREPPAERRPAPRRSPVRKRKMPAGERAGMLQRVMSKIPNF